MKNRTHALLPDRWEFEVPRHTCSRDETLLEAATRKWGPNAELLFWDRAPPGADVVGAIRARASDPYYPVWISEP